MLAAQQQTERLLTEALDEKPPENWRALVAGALQARGVLPKKPELSRGPVKLTRQEIEELKKSVGRKPFDERVRFVNDFAKCPFHSGDGDKTLHLVTREGTWLATCFSRCNKSFDAIAFVKEFDKLASFPQAIDKLQGKTVRDEQPKPPKKPMNPPAWIKWGREITQADVDRLTKSRPHSHTANLETFQRLGCRVKGDFIGFPYFYPKNDNAETPETDCYTVKMRHMDRKEMLQENSVSQYGLYNLSTVSPFDDVFVTEGEPDALTLEQFAFAAVSVTTGKQKEFDARALEILKSANRVFLVGDQETIGKQCMDALGSHLPKCHRITFTDAKDVGELALKLGSEFPRRFEELRDIAATSWVSRNIPTLGALSTEPPKWLVHELFPYSGLTMLAGNMGAMKSLLALFGAGALEAGTKFLGRKVLQATKVLYVDRENSENDIGVRKQRMGLPDAVHYWGDWLPDGTPNLEDERLAEFAAHGGFIVFDSFQQWMEAGMSENDNGAMTELTRKFRRLARLGAGVLFLHHAPKYGEAQYRGGTSIPNNTDMAIGVTKTDDGVLQLREIRFRGCAKWEIDAKVQFGEHYTYDVIRDESKGQAVKAAKDKRDSQSEWVLEFVKNHGSPSQSEIVRRADAAIGLKRNTCQNLLSQLAKRGKLEIVDGPKNASHYRIPDENSAAGLVAEGLLPIQSSGNTATECSPATASSVN